MSRLGAWYMGISLVPGSIGMYLEPSFISMGLVLDSVVSHLGPGSAWVDLDPYPQVSGK